ncbi:MAG: GNAT family N-acetyltransferase [Treponema sp.]|nr:GNAT family N-acetyltransferase [Treponema sp.]
MENIAGNTPLDDLQVSFVDAEEKIDNARFDSLIAADNIQHTTKYLQTLSKTLDNSFKGYFVVASKTPKTAEADTNADTEIVAWTYIFVDSRLAFHGLLSGFTEKLYKIFPITFKTVFISSPVAEYNIVHVKDKYKIQEHYIIDKMMDEVLKFGKRQKAKLIIAKDHINRYTSEYFHQKFIHVHFMPGTFIDLESIHSKNHSYEDECGTECSGFDDYLMGLKKKWRANIRNKINRRKDDLKVEVIDAANLTDAECAHCHELYFHTRGKQRLKHECLSTDYFCQTGKEFGGACKMLIAKKDDQIIGFAQLLENGDDVINVRMGMDYKCNKEYNLYYHLLYENIIYCIRKKKKRLYTSQTSYRPKLEVGAKLLPLHTYVYFENPILQKIFGKVITTNCRCYSELLSTDDPAEVLAKHKLSTY